MSHKTDSTFPWCSQMPIVFYHKVKSVLLNNCVVSEMGSLCHFHTAQIVGIIERETTNTKNSCNSKHPKTISCQINIDACILTFNGFHNFIFPLQFCFLFPAYFTQLTSISLQVIMFIIQLLWEVSAGCFSKHLN